MRKKIIAGNWKMNLNYAEALSLVDMIVDQMEDEGMIELVLAPPFIYLRDIVSRVQGCTRLSIAAQNCSQYKNGAHTGEISSSMLSSVGVECVIVGHSERRAEQNETNSIIKTKVDNILEQFLIPIFCCGETAEQRKAGQHGSIIKEQLEQSLFHLNQAQLLSCIIAYEPVWAIGTGLNANTQQIQEMHALIRKLISDHYKNNIGDKISILYGGSVNSSNAAEIFSSADVDGALIGGASLKSTEFTAIISELEKTLSSRMV
ncbi:MAG TPA: triose-phosphate isomerase [Bacteroidia bacterium]|nr:triose-phosphate isomerase [Bacteroidia bacterium]